MLQEQEESEEESDASKGSEVITIETESDNQGKSEDHKEDDSLV